MKINFHKILLGCIPIGLLPFLASAAAYKGLSGAGDTIKDGNAGNAPTQLPVLIGTFITGILSILGIILVVYIIQAGILYMTAAGDDTKVGKAKKMIQTAVIGAIIVVAAYSIASFVISTISYSTDIAAQQLKP